MTQFSSRPPFNDDPNPYSCDMKQPGALRHSESDAWSCKYHTFDPRPEFDRPQHNTSNAILVEFRETLQTYQDKSLCLTHYLDYLTRGQVYGWGQDHIEHATKVLRRLVQGGAR